MATPLHAYFTLFQMLHEPHQPPFVRKFENTFSLTAFFKYDKVILNMIHNDN